MLSAALIAVSLLISYVLVIALTGFSAFAITGFMPSFAVQNRRLRGIYNLTLHLLWLLYSVVGGYVAATAAMDAQPRLAAILLAVVLITVIWMNLSEARQRGLIHMLLTSACILAGVTAGYLLRIQQSLLQ